MSSSVAPSATPASAPHALPAGFTQEDVAAAAEHRGCPVLLPDKGAREGAASSPEQQQHAVAADRDTGQKHPNVRRITLPWVADIVIVSGADEIRAFETDPSVGRPAEGKIPGWFFALMKVSKFYSTASKRWWIGMESSTYPTRNVRLDYIRSHLEEGFKREDVETCAKLLLENASDAALASFGARLVARHFVSDPLPDNVVDAAMLSITQGTPDPVTYVRSARAQNVLYEFLKDRVPGEHVEDVIHGIRSGADSVVAGLKAVRSGTKVGPAGGDAGKGEHSHADVRRALCTAPPVTQVPRVAKGGGTVGGLLGKPLVPDHTFILLANGRAASTTQSELFLFSAGTTDRQCPFKSYFMELADQVATQLRELQHT